MRPDHPEFRAYTLAGVRAHLASARKARLAGETRRACHYLGFARIGLQELRLSRTYPFRRNPQEATP